jgi:hypothetical protein
MSTYLYFRGQVALSHEDLQGYPLYVWLFDELVVKDDIAYNLICRLFVVRSAFRPTAMYQSNDQVRRP